MLTYSNAVDRMGRSITAATHGFHNPSSLYHEVDYLMRNEFKPMCDAGGIAGRIGASLHPTFYTGCWMDKKDWVAEVVLFAFMLWPHGVSKGNALAAILTLDDDSKCSRKMSVAIFLVKNVLVDIGEDPKAGQASIAALRFAWPRVAYVANELVKAQLEYMEMENDWMRVRAKEMFSPYIMAGMNTQETSRFVNSWRMFSADEVVKEELDCTKRVHQMFKFADQLFMSEEKRFITAEMKSIVPANEFGLSNKPISDFDSVSMGVEVTSSKVPKVSREMEEVFAVEDDEISVITYYTQASEKTGRWSSNVSGVGGMQEIKEALEEAGFSDDMIYSPF